MDMNANDALDLVMVTTRGIVLVIAALGAIMSIILGWQLHRDLVKSPVMVELNAGQTWKAKLVSRGPGAAFALFGMVLLVVLVRQSVVTEDISAEPTTQASPSSAPAGLAQPSMFSAPPHNSAASLLLISGTSQADTKSTRECFVSVRRRRFMDGGSLTPSKIRSDLGTAIRLIKRLDDDSLGATGQTEKRAALDTLADLMESTGSWPLP
jgi:hypothetical protein